MAIANGSARSIAFSVVNIHTFVSAYRSFGASGPRRAYITAHAVTGLPQFFNCSCAYTNSNSNCGIRASYKTWHRPLLLQVLPIHGIRRGHQSHLGKRLATNINKARVGRSKVDHQSERTYSPISVTLRAQENLSFLIRPRGPTVLS
jgi:hypothetical protein